MQILSQDGTKAVVYKGVSLSVNDRGLTLLNVLTEGGKAFIMGYFRDYEKAKQIVREIISSVGKRTVYCIPKEQEEK